MNPSGALPLDLPGLLVWLKSDAGLFQDTGKTTPAVSADDPVRVWADQSGNGNDAEASADGKRPLLKLAEQNGMNAVLFDAINDCLVTPSLSYGIFTIFCVFATASAATDFVLYERSADANTIDGEFLFAEAAGQAQINVRRTTLTKWRTGDVINDQSWFISTHTYNGNNADHLLRLNGSLVSFGSNPFFADPGTGSISDVMNVGSRDDGLDLFSNAYFGEFIIYDSVLSADNISLVETYLNGRFATF